MHAVRRFSLRPLRDLAVFSRRVSIAALGPAVEDGLPQVSSSSSSPSGRDAYQATSNHGSSSKGSPQSLPRKLSLALLAPLFGVVGSAEDDDEVDHEADYAMDEKVGRATVPNHQRGSSRGPLLIEPRVQRHKHRPKPSIFTGLDPFDPSLASGVASSPSPSPVETVDPLELDGGPLAGRRLPGRSSIKRTTRRCLSMAGLVIFLFVLLAAVVFVEAVGRSPALSTSMVAPGQVDQVAMGSPTAGGPSAWWRPSTLSDSTWLPWASSSMATTNDEGIADDHEAFVERNLYRRFPSPAFVDLHSAPGRAGALSVEILNDQCLESCGS